MPTGETKLFHYEQFEFRVGESLAGWYLAGWMQRYLDEVELPKLKELIERDTK